MLFCTHRYIYRYIHIHVYTSVYVRICTRTHAYEKGVIVCSFLCSLGSEGLVFREKSFSVSFLDCRIIIQVCCFGFVKVWRLRFSGFLFEASLW